MSETTVGQLPEEVLVEVFKWLDKKSLQNTLLTCREWKEVVERSISWTLKLDYENGKPQHQMTLVLESNRKYDKVVIIGDGNNGTLQILEKHGGRIKELKFIGWTEYNALLFCQTLNKMPKLELVDMQGVIKVGDQNRSLLPALHHLKSLEMVDSSYDMLKFFVHCQIQKLKIFPEEPRQAILDFLATQERLEELELYGYHQDDDNIDVEEIQLFVAPIPKESIAFRLKKLSLLDIDLRETPNGDDNFMEFVRLHVESLEELQVDEILPDFFYVFVFAHLKHLKTLDLYLDGRLNFDSSFFEQLEVNTSETSLLIHSDSSNVTEIKGFVSRLPNVENLYLDADCPIDLAKYIAENMKKLKKFSVECIYGQKFDGLQFNVLEALQRSKNFEVLPRASAASSTGGTDQRGIKMPSTFWQSLETRSSIS